jgi:DNA polymerase elongation subunit (family B)
MLITSRKKYVVVYWNDGVEAKGMALGKKDVIPVARQATIRT